MLGVVWLPHYGYSTFVASICVELYSIFDIISNFSILFRFVILLCRLNVIVIGYFQEPERLEGVFYVEV